MIVYLRSKLFATVKRMNVTTVHVHPPPSSAPPVLILDQLYLGCIDNLAHTNQHMYVLVWFTGP